MINKFLNKIFQKQDKKIRLTVLLPVLGILLLIAVIPSLSFKSQLFANFYSQRLSGVAGVSTSAYFTLQSGSSFTQAQEITMRILIQSDTDSANTFVSKINFPANLLSVSRIDTAGSFIAEWTETYFDNTFGKISLVGGVPNPGYKTAGFPALLATVYFTAKTTGTASLAYDPAAAIYRNSDNANILGTPSGINIVISPIPSPTPTPSPIPTPTSVPDTTSPTVSITSPLNGSQVSAAVNVTASASDNIGVSKVEFYLDGSLKQTSTTLPFSWLFNTTTVLNGSHSVTARAYDAAGNTASDTITLNVLNGDTTLPSAPTNLAATAVSYHQVNLSWTASTDNVGVVGYYVVRNGVTIGIAATSSYIDGSVLPASYYSYYVIAYDAAGNRSSNSNTASVTTPAVPDTQPPFPPANLTANAVSSSQINLSWTASTDNVGVVGYYIYRGSSKIATVATTSYGDTNLASSTSYTYYVKAYDSAGNVSSSSNLVTVTTQTSNLLNYGAITGTVYSSNGSTLSKAQVNLVVNGRTKSYSTNYQGFYYISKLPPGTYKVSYVVRGKSSWMYYAVTKDVTVYAGQTTVQDAIISTR